MSINEQELKEEIELNQVADEEFDSSDDEQDISLDAIIASLEKSDINAISFPFINDDDLVFLCAVLQNNTTITQLSFREFTFNVDGAQALSGLLGVNQNIKILDLGGYKEREEDALFKILDIIFLALKTNRTLETLLLERVIYGTCHFAGPADCPNKFCDWIISLVQNNDGLREINIDHNYTTNEHMKLYLPVLEKSSIEKFIHGCNTLTVEDECALAQIFFQKYTAKSQPIDAFPPSVMPYFNYVRTPEEKEKRRRAYLKSIEQSGDPDMPDMIPMIFDTAQKIRYQMQDNILLMMGRTPAWLVEAFKIMGEESKIRSFHYSGQPYFDVMPTRSQIANMRTYLVLRGISLDSLQNSEEKYTIVDVVHTGQSIKSMCMFLSHWLYEKKKDCQVDASTWASICMATAEHNMMLKKIDRIIPLGNSTYILDQDALWGIVVDKERIEWPLLFTENEDHTFGIKYKCIDWDKPEKLAQAERESDPAAVISQQAMQKYYNKRL